MAGEAATHTLEVDENGEIQLEKLTVITGPQIGAIRYTDDASALETAQKKAEEIRKRIEAQGWAVQLRKGQPAYVKCEGWVALASLCGLTPTIIGTAEMTNGARSAVAELRDASGFAFVRADAECGDDLDGRWAREPGYSKRSMAQTRAVSKACRVALSWIMSLAGYSPMPYEEVAGRDFAEDPIVERLKNCIRTMRDNHLTMHQIFAALDDADEDSARDAAEAWFELENEEKKALWISPRDGGPFTTEERELMKSTAFRELYYGKEKQD